MSAYKLTPRAVATPDAPQKPLVQKRASSGGANWVQVTRAKSSSKAQRPRTVISGPSSCASSTLQLHLLKNVTIYPPAPPTHMFLKRPFRTDFKKHTPPPPPTGRNFGALDQKFIKPRKSAKTHHVGTTNDPERYVFLCISGIQVRPPLPLQEPNMTTSACHGRPKPHSHVYPFGVASVVTAITACPSSCRIACDMH